MANDEPGGRRLPTFLGIGVPRGGTTWLHDLLASHPQVCMPTRRKELNFFDLNYHRGLDWYERCFDVPLGSPPPRAIGEITPVYVYSDDCRRRIADVGTVQQFLVTLRDPVDLFESAYRQMSAILDFRGNFHQFIDVRPDVLKNGLYARALAPWIEEWGRDRFLILRFETMTTDVEATRDTLGTFLGLDTGLFPAESGTRRVNESFSPRFPRTYGLMKRAVNRLHQGDHSRVIALGRRVGLSRLMHARSSDVGRGLTDEQRAELRAMYCDDLHELEVLIGADLSTWATA